MSKTLGLAALARAPDGAACYQFSVGIAQNYLLLYEVALKMGTSTLKNKGMNNVGEIK